jgi:hypothetical protein
MPLLVPSLDNILFDKFERNVFYAVGTKNLNFEPELPESAMVAQ